MPNKQKHKTRREKLEQTPPHPSTRGDRGRSVVGRLCQDCPALLHEIAALRYEGVWFQHKEDETTHISLRRQHQRKNCVQSKRYLEKDEEIDPTNVRETARGAELKFAAHTEFFESRDVQERSNEPAGGSEGATDNN